MTSPRDNHALPPSHYNSLRGRALAFLSLGMPVCGVPLPRARSRVRVLLFSRGSERLRYALLSLGTFACSVPLPRACSRVRALSFACSGCWSPGRVIRLKAELRG